MTASYLDEIMEQPGMLTRLAQGLAGDVALALAQVRLGLLAGDYDRIVLTGMGSSLHGLYPLHLLLSQSLPVPSIHVDASELVQQTPDIIGARTLLIAVSQSGESGEIIALAQLGLTGPRTVISVTNMAGNTLSTFADISLVSNAGAEMTVSSKSYTGGLACLHLVGAMLTGADIKRSCAELARAAEACGAMLSGWQATLADLVGFLDPTSPLVYVGRGRSLASANLAGLLTMEAAKLHCAPMSGGQFRHGPIELVRAGFALAIFLGDRKTRDIDDALIDKVLGLGGRVVAISPAATAPAARERLRVIAYPDVPTPLNPIMEALFVQVLQIPLAAARGYTAGAFLNATKITAVV